MVEFYDTRSLAEFYDTRGLAEFEWSKYSHVVIRRVEFHIQDESR